MLAYIFRTLSRSQQVGLFYLREPYSPQEVVRISFIF